MLCKLTGMADRGGAVGLVHYAAAGQRMRGFAHRIRRMGAALDIRELVGNPEEFPILHNRVFMNHAAVSPLTRRAAMAIIEYAGRCSEHAYLDATWYKQIEQLRQSFAALLNATQEEIAFVKNTSEGLALVANGIDWHEQDRIVTTAVEYPANVYPWIDLQQRKGIELVRIEEQETTGVRRVPQEAILQAAEHPRTRLVTLSHVEFGSGQRHDLIAIGQFCRQRNIRLCVDAIQSLGVIPIDVRAMNIDYLSADGHKWMLGPEGAGVFFCRKELIGQTHPALIGWLNVRNAQDFDHIHYELRADARRFECGSLNVPGLLALKASIGLLWEIGIPALWNQVRALTGRLSESLRQDGWTIASPREEGESSGIVSFWKSGTDPQAIFRKLREAKIDVAVRANRIRCSPHFYNTREEIERLIAALRE